MDLDGIEEVDTNALGGADQITVNDVTGSDLTAVNLNLAGRVGGGDGAADSVIVNGTNDNDVVKVTGTAADGVTVSGPKATTRISGTDAGDTLTVKGTLGDDAIDGSTLAAGAVAFTADGGDGDDALRGLRTAGRFGAITVRFRRSSRLRAMVELRPLRFGDAEHRALSARSVNYIATILHRALRDAVRWKAIVRNPADFADPPQREDRPEMRTWSAAELGRFLEQVAGDRFAGGWWLLATTGMRRGEALGLRWSDVDLDRGIAKITRTLVSTGVQRRNDPGMAWGTPKTAKGRRSVALDPATVAALRAHRARQLAERLAMGVGYADEDLVVCLPDGRPVHPKNLSYYFVQEIKRAGLSAIRLHDLRHTHATLALRAGVHPRVVQERLGHAMVSITLDTYSHVDLDMQAEAAARVAKLVNGENG